MSDTPTHTGTYTNHLSGEVVQLHGDGEEFIRADIPWGDREGNEGPGGVIWRPLHYLGRVVDNIQPIR